MKQSDGLGTQREPCKKTNDLFHFRRFWVKNRRHSQKYFISHENCYLYRSTRRKLLLLIESSEETIAILGDRWWPQTAKQDGDRISKQFVCNIWKKRNECPNVGGVSIRNRSRNGAPSRKGWVVNGQMTKASNKLVRPP